MGLQVSTHRAWCCPASGTQWCWCWDSPEQHRAYTSLGLSVHRAHNTTLPTAVPASGTQPVPFPGVAQSVHRPAGEALRTSWHQSGSYLECAPDLPLAHHPPPASAEPTGVHLGAPPVARQTTPLGPYPQSPRTSKSLSHARSVSWLAKP